MAAVLTKTAMDDPQTNSTTENTSPELLEPLSVSTPSNTSQATPVTSVLSELEEETSLAAPTPNVRGNPSPAEETPLDPKVAALLAMFPDFDTSLLQSVLESVTGEQDRAVDVLLGMSDPSYTSTERADATQTELDEEIARRLMLEEVEQRRPWQPQGSGETVPYQPRSHPAQGPDGSHQRPVEGDGVAQFQEQLGKFAETGKKTFTTLLSKVKAKMQEFDGSPRQEQPSGSGRPLPRGDSWNTPVQSQSYYDPNPPRTVEGYDVGPIVLPHTVSIDHASPPTVTQPTHAAQPAGPTAAGTTSPPPDVEVPTTGAVDPAKMGLFPKRPVSLGSSSQPSRSLEDDVEYVENPFEDSHGH